jgi:hypothetical protein
MRGNRGGYKDPDEKAHPETFSFTQADLDRIERIQELMPAFKNNKSRLVRKALEEYEVTLRRGDGSMPDHSEVLEYLYRFTLENASKKYNLAAVTGIIPNHRLGSAEKRVYTANEFIRVLSATKDSSGVGKMFDEYFDNVEFILWAHAHLETSEFLSKLPAVSRDEIMSQIFVALLMAKADPNRPSAQRFIETYTELIPTDHLKSLT